jgi:cytosine/adenosine deaminase-related metal-dependent hydrolase
VVHYHASWIVPIARSPIEDGWIAIDSGRIADVSDRPPAGDDTRIDLGHVAVLPGLVNAHTHLELSYLASEVPPASDFVTWVRGMMAARRSHPDPASPAIMAAVDHAIADAVSSGTAVVGDVSNSLVTFTPLERSALAAVVFYELIRFNAPDPHGFVGQALAQIAAFAPSDRVRLFLAPHAPYSVAPEVFDAIKEALERNSSAICTVHLSESVEECEFIRGGEGPWRRVLEDLGAWNPQWTPPGCTPVQFLEMIGFLGPRLLAVHGVQMEPADLERLACLGTTLVTCPRSNVYTGAGSPPIEAFYQSGVRVAVGTDSLASAPDLNIFSELATLRRLAPSIPASKLLESATLQGARALGFGTEYGTIEPGKRARLLTVGLPGEIAAVEEYLVSGIRPEQVQWVPEGA